MPRSLIGAVCTRCGLTGDFDVCPRCADVNVRVTLESIRNGTSPGPRPSGLDPITVEEYVGRRRAFDKRLRKRMRDRSSDEGADWSAPL